MDFILTTDNKIEDNVFDSTNTTNTTSSTTFEEKEEIDNIDISLSIDWIINLPTRFSPDRNSINHFNNRTKNKDHQGPTGVSNWLSKNICVGGSIDYKTHLDLLIAAGIDVFVSLIGVDKVKLRLYDYEKVLPADKIYISEPIQDMNIISDDKVLALARRIVAMIRKGHKVYIHCSGGHGRTGTIVAIVLHLLYGLSLYQIRDYLQYSHDQRLYNFSNLLYNCQLDKDDMLRDYFQEGQVPTPQVGIQLKQVERIINALIADSSV
jgi:protein-tyrosine phosphatase